MTSARWIRSSWGRACTASRSFSTARTRQRPSVFSRTRCCSSESRARQFRATENGETFATQIFTPDAKRSVCASTARRRTRASGSYVRLGWLHLLHSPDRLLVLLGLLLLVRRRIQLGYLAGGLVLGYALALAVGLTGWVIPRMPLLEAFVGFIAVLLLVEIVARNGGRRSVAVGAVAVLRPLRSWQRSRWVSRLRSQCWERR